VLQKGFSVENLFLRRNKLGMRHPLSLFMPGVPRANVPYKCFSLLARLFLIPSATPNFCSALHPPLMHTSGISFM